MTSLRQQATSALVATGLVAASSAGARCEDVYLTRIAAPTNASLHGVTTLRDRTWLAAYPAPGTFVGARGSDDPHPPAAGLNDTVRGAIGCTIGGTVATAVALAAGGENTVNLVAGGLVPSVNRAALYVGMVGVVFGSFCAIGQALTPIVTRQVVDPPSGAPPPHPPPRFDTRHAAAEATIPQRMAYQSGVLGTAVASGARRIGATALANVSPNPPREALPVRVAQQP